MADHLQSRDLCHQPTLEEWLDDLSRLTPVSLSTPAAEAVRQAREAEDGGLTDALAEVRPSNLHGEVDWGPPVGKEIW